MIHRPHSATDNSKMSVSLLLQISFKYVSALPIFCRRVAATTVRPVYRSGCSVMGKWSLLLAALLALFSLPGISLQLLQLST